MLFMKSSSRRASSFVSSILFISLVSFFHDNSYCCKVTRLIPAVNAFNLHTKAFSSLNQHHHNGDYRPNQLLSLLSPLYLRKTAKFTKTRWNILQNKERISISSPSSRKTTTVMSLAAGGGEGRNNNNDEDSNIDDRKKNDDNKRKKEEESLSFNEILDKQFFDPDKILQEEEQQRGGQGQDDSTNTTNPIVRWYANLLKDDYELAETLYVGIFCVTLIVITQEVLRMTMYGDNYIPFMKGGANGIGIGGGGGKLF